MKCNPYTALSGNVINFVLTIIVFWGIAPCSLPTKGTAALKMEVAPIFLKLHDITIQKSLLLIFTVMSSSNPNFILLNYIKSMLIILYENTLEKAY